MKPLSDKAMKGKGGGPQGAFFPNEPKHMDLQRVGKIKGFDYPDTQEDIYGCQADTVKKISANMPKPEYRH